MAKNIRILYLYLVSLIALVMMVVGFISTVNRVASYYYPVVYYYPYDKYDNNTYAYNYDEGLARETRNEKRENIKEAISYSAVTVVGTCLFTYHWKKIQNERKEEEK